MRIIALGINPKKGGRPARDINRIKIIEAYKGETWIKLVAKASEDIFVWWRFHVIAVNVMA